MQTIDRVGSGQTRAQVPDSEGYVERDGVRVHYEVFGSGATTVLLLPTWAIVHSHAWKMQVPYLARHFRVITFDGRGNGLSDRPEEPEAYAEAEYAADALAVLDATETERAFVVGHSMGGQRGLLLAADHPDRVEGVVFIGPAVPFAAQTPRARAATSFERRAGLLRGLGQVQPPLLAERLRRLPVLLLLADLHRAALDQADRGLRRLGSADHSGDADRNARRHVRRGDRAGARRARPLSGPGDPRPRGRDPLAGVGRHACRADGRRHGQARGLRARAACPRPGEGQPAPARFRLARAAGRPLGARPVTPQAGAVHLVADRARARPARRRDRRRAPGAAPRARDRLARAASGHRGARGPRRAHPPGERRPGERIASHRVRVGGARPPLLPGLAADGRDPVRELHGLPRPRSRLRSTTSGSATRPGSSTTTCTRTRS